MTLLLKWNTSIVYTGDRDTGAKFDGTLLGELVLSGMHEILISTTGREPLVSLVRNSDEHRRF